MGPAPGNGQPQLCEPLALYLEGGLYTGCTATQCSEMTGRV